MKKQPLARDRDSLQARAHEMQLHAAHISTAQSTHQALSLVHETSKGVAYCICVTQQVIAQLHYQ
jgi:hypothetical protein